MPSSKGSSSPIDRLTYPIRVFFEHKLAGAALLVGATVAALIWANSPWGESYRALLDATFTIGVEEFKLSKALHLWINDGLMGIFFFVVGLEIKREFLAGELTSLKKAMLPIAAALGGIIAPALIYVAFNYGGPGIDGWAIPMATDIAFCLGMLALLGDKVPPSLKVFLTALAIVDDIGAIVVIAVFYTDDISLLSLGLGGAVLIVSMGANKLGVRSSLFYFILGALTWLFFLKSGVHATLAAVLMAFTIPARTRIQPMAFVAHVQELLERFKAHTPEGTSVAGESFLTYGQHHVLDELEDATSAVLPPVQELEHALVPLVTFVVLPIFALANAGVRLDASVVGELANPVSLGIILGLFFGKQVGVLGASWLAVKVGVANLPGDLTMKHIYGGGILAGIGFTMSLFIGGLAFDDPLLGELSKMSILIASLLAAVVGYVFLRYFTPDPTPEPAPAAEADQL